METILESDSLSELLTVARKMHANAIKAGAKRVLTSIKIDDRLDKKSGINDKVRSVRAKL